MNNDQRVALATRGTDQPGLCPQCSKYNLTLQPRRAAFLVCLRRAAPAPVQPRERDSVMRICRKRLWGIRIDGPCRAKRLPWHTGDGPSSSNQAGAILICRDAWRCSTKDPTERIEQ